MCVGPYPPIYSWYSRGFVVSTAVFCLTVVAYQNFFHSLVLRASLGKALTEWHDQNYFACSWLNFGLESDFDASLNPEKGLKLLKRAQD